MALQRENAREALKLRIYETLLQKIRTLSDAHIAASMYAFGILPAIESFRREQAAGYHPSPIKQRAPTFSSLHFEAEGHLAELIVEFESWSIAFPGLDVFQVALNAAAYDVRAAFPPLFSALLHVLPQDPLPGETDKPSIIHPLPSAEAFAMLKRLIEEYKEAMDEIRCYLQDLTREAQTIFCTDCSMGMFHHGNRLTRSTGLSQQFQRRRRNLIRYFKTETPRAKSMAAINASVIGEVRAKAAVESGRK